LIAREAEDAAFGNGAGNTGSRWRDVRGNPNVEALPSDHDSAGV
jgi:hypothetical protein